MNLKVLIDNNTYIDNYYYGEPGLAIYIEDENKKILFDTGYSNIILKNSRLMDIDLHNLDYVALSHGHDDHTGGLIYLNDGYLMGSRLISHKDTFINREHYGKSIGSPIKKEDLKVKEYIDGTNGYKITNNLYYLGEIKRKFDFEHKDVGNLASGEKDYVNDDTALVYKTDNGLFIITGCSHSGICNIIEQAKSKCNDNKIIGIIGGFHLFNNDERLSKTIEYFKNNNITNIYPCHCVSLEVKAELCKHFKVKEVAVGFELNI